MKKLKLKGHFLCMYMILPFNSTLIAFSVPLYNARFYQTFNCHINVIVSFLEWLCLFEYFSHEVTWWYNHQA